MKKLITIILTIFSFIWLASCKKALTEKMHSAVTPGNFYVTGDDAEAAVNGIFANLQLQEFYGRTVYIVNELSGDVFRPNNVNSDRAELYTGTYTPANGQINNWWLNSYKMIKNANDVITYVPGISMDVTQRNNLVGVAYFMRALGYYNLVTVFGDVPLVFVSNGQDLYPARKNADSVYSQLIRDLKYAEANCLHTDALPSSEVGRPTSEAASALLARAYLQRGGTSYAHTSDNQDALSECNKLIAYSASHPAVLSLAANYGDNFNVNTKNGPENIFSVQFGDPPNNITITNLMFDPESLGGFASFLPLDSFVHSFAPVDKRIAASIGTVDGGITYISKYRDPGVAAGSLGRNNWDVLRYADVLLMQSEAMNNINANDANKFNGINLVRTRAGLGSSLLSFSNTASSDDFINALVNERLWEFSVEGHRRNDLIRLKKFQQFKAAEGFVIDNNHLLMPIPQSEMDLNPSLVQNKGY